MEGGRRGIQTQTHRHTRKYDPKKEILSFATWMDLEGIMLR